MTEVTRWNRRLNILTSISDQLNSKQSKAIIGYFLASKSKYLKQWKLIDSRYFSTVAYLILKYCSYKLTYSQSFNVRVIS